MNDRLILKLYGHRLTAKELEVLELRDRGMSQRSIALALGLSRSSVQSRMEGATRKLQMIIREETAA